MINQRIGYQLKRVSHALRVQMDRQLRNVRLTTPQYAALSAIEEMPGLSGNRLAQRCFVTSQTMHLVLVSLEKAGLITRQIHPGNERSLQTYLTPAGKKLLQESHHGILAIEETMINSLTEDERSQLLQLLRTCANALEAPKGYVKRSERGKRGKKVQ